MSKTLVAQIKGNKIVGKILDMLKSMSQLPKVSLINQDRIRQTSPPTTCLKQGDVFSTILLNIYINDLPGDYLKIIDLQILTMRYHILMTPK